MGSETIDAVRDARAVLGRRIVEPGGALLDQVMQHRAQGQRLPVQAHGTAAHAAQFLVVARFARIEQLVLDRVEPLRGSGSPPPSARRRRV
jgi:hypothetical protein